MNTLLNVVAMRRLPVLLTMLLFVLPHRTIHAQTPALSSGSLEKLANTHDLSLPDWGPYTKRYIGVSHIPEKKSGLRFDLSVFPGFYRRKVEVPNVHYETDYHPWEASPNLEYFSFRHELTWKDQVYTDISYSEVSSTARLVRIACVNNTENYENLAVHFMASMNFPPIKEYSPYTPIYPALVKMPEGAQWINAIDYEDLKFAHTRPTDNLVYDGKMRGEIRDNGFVNGSGIGKGFGLDKNDVVSYRMNIEKDIPEALLLIRYRMASGQHVSFALSGVATQDLTFNGGDDFGIDTVRIGMLSKGEHAFTLTSNGGAGVDINGFIVTPSAVASSIAFTKKEWNPVPKITKGPIKNSITLKYDDTNVYYGLLWQFDEAQVREWYGRDLSDIFKRMVNEHVQTVFQGEGVGHYTNVFLRPIIMQPKSVKNIYAIICCGTKEEVEKQLTELNTTPASYENIYAAARGHVVKMDGTPDGDQYKFSIERMNATLACNVVYPIYTQKDYIRHSAPGRWWDCLYTWDSGFIGMGLLQTDTKRAIENLNAYMQEPGAQSAFIHHGSPVPVQHYLFLELWNATQSKDVLEYFYPRLKQYHEFMAGRLGSSTTRVLKSNILKTWDYFYNSGGWDDLPPQKYTHDNTLESTVAPVITSSQVIRTAKILKMAAARLGKNDDIKAYDDDIAVLTNALQKFSWDEKSGYFGYVVHDSTGNPLHVLKYQDSVNYDMGFDGAYPLIAGICTDQQKKGIVASLKSDKHLWSKAGLTAVDQSAPYYQNDGYWNGTVWMSHQWFFWKTMLDLGESEFAYKIAKKALDVWKHETEISYNCMEHFLNETARGAGWHEFGGLSSPVVMWYSAYFRPGNFSTGFDLWLENRKFNKDNSAFSVDVNAEGNLNRATSVVACMNPAYSYAVTWNGKPLASTAVGRGTLSITIPIDTVKRGKLEIHKK
ncbi:MAG TPA: trehalase family glycosidase [Bacteroidota bacterium]|nr:trehalase family glycosidase [Bacteroidota bacterium]